MEVVVYAFIDLLKDSNKQKTMITILVFSTNLHYCVGHDSW